MSHVDILIEQLKNFEETQLLELLDLTSEDIVERFRDVIFRRREYLYGEIEMLNIDLDQDNEVFVDHFEGYQIEEGDD
jgi:hypothetical protein